MTRRTHPALVRYGRTVRAQATRLLAALPAELPAEVAQRRWLLTSGAYDAEPVCPRCHRYHRRRP